MARTCSDQIPVRISDLNCDYFAASPHKWMFAAPGSGLLYVREENIGKLWPSIVTGNWDDTKLGAARFMMVGTNNRAVVEGAVAGLKFFQTLGPDNVYKRIHELALDVRRRARRFPYLELLTPDDDRMYGGLVTFKFRDKDPKPFRDALQEAANLALWRRHASCVHSYSYSAARSGCAFYAMRETR